MHLDGASELVARIIIVDDDEIVTDIASEALSAAGHMVSAVHDGAEALGAIRDGDPDLLILDYELPSRTGMEILRQIRNLPRGADMLILMITGHDSRLMKARAEFTGVDDFVGKPFQPNHLVSRVEALLGKRH
jgi:DNA-binding response OmpR family regulator